MCARSSCACLPRIVRRRVSHAISSSWRAGEQPANTGHGCSPPVDALREDGPRDVRRLRRPAVTTSAPNAPIPAAAQARLDDLRLEVVRLGSSVTFAISSASQALSDGDLDEANRVVADDDAVDAQRHAIEDECMRLLGSSGARRTGPALRRLHAPRRTRARAHGRPDGQCRPHGLAPLSQRARRTGPKPHPPARPAEPRCRSGSR